MYEIAICDDSAIDIAQLRNQDGIGSGGAEVGIARSKMSEFNTMKSISMDEKHGKGKTHRT